MIVAPQVNSLSLPLLPTVLPVCRASYKWIEWEEDVWQQACLPSRSPHASKTNAGGLTQRSPSILSPTPHPPTHQKIAPYPEEFTNCADIRTIPRTK